MQPNDDASNAGQMNDQTSSGRVSHGFGEAASDVLDAAKSKGEEAAKGARAAAERGKNKLVEEAQGVAQALHQASDGMRGAEHEELARYTQSLADKIEQISGSLKDRDLASMVEDVTRLAKRQPALFLGGAFTAGLVAARFFKSKERQTDSQAGGF